MKLADIFKHQAQIITQQRALRMTRHLDSLPRRQIRINLFEQFGLMALQLANLLGVCILPGLLLNPKLLYLLVNRYILARIRGEEEFEAVRLEVASE